MLQKFEEALKKDEAGNTYFEKTSMLLMAYDICKDGLDQIRLKLQKRSQRHRLLNTLEWPFVIEAHRLRRCKHTPIDADLPLCIDNRWL